MSDCQHENIVWGRCGNCGQVMVIGRPDLVDHSFGQTKLKRFAPYVYSRLGGMLVHRVREVVAQWYDPAPPLGENLIRLESPRLTYVTNCGQWFYGGVEREKRAQTCRIPQEQAVLCGRCDGTGPVFGRGLHERMVTRADARKRLGCVAVVGGDSETEEL